MTPHLFIVLGYLLGSIPFGLLLTRAAGLGDIRAIGSGNIGATNVLRTGRRGLAAATLLLDGAKGAAAVLLARALGGPEAALWAGLGAVLGHLFPVWLRFRGGKGVATGYGVLIAAAWPVGLLAGAIWLVMAKISRLSSASALTSFALAPVLALLLADRATALLALAIAVLIFARHHANIRRLLAGTEPRIGNRA
jgi:glycerol-3-phosphate acyltransferase PlsY